MVASCDAINDCQFSSVTDSPANPIEWWPADCNTYNETKVCGVHPKCFCAPWNCDDIINDQFTDTVDGEYNLKVLSEEGDALVLIPYVKIPPLSLVSLSLFDNTGSGVAWTLGSAPEVSLSYVGVPVLSQKLRGALIGAAANTDYEFHYRIHNSFPGIGANGQIHIYLYDASMVLLDELDIVFSGSDSFYEGDVTFNGGSLIPAYVAVEILQLGGSTTMIVNEFDLLTEGTGIYQYDASFVPSENEICDQRITFQRVTDTSPDEIVRKADCFDVREDHPCTVLIEYWNNKDILGLIYTTGSPQTTFFIRVFAEFFHEDFPEEEEVMELTQSVEVLNSQITEKKFMRINYAPYYLHRKLKYIFKHQFILINNDYWTRADEYKIIEGNRMWPVKMGEVWLTNKNSVQRAVL